MCWFSVGEARGREGVVALFILRISRVKNIAKTVMLCFEKQLLIRAVCGDSSTMMDFFVRRLERGDRLDERGLAN